MGGGRCVGIEEAADLVHLAVFVTLVTGDRRLELGEQLCRELVRTGCPFLDFLVDGGPHLAEEVLPEGALVSAHAAERCFVQRDVPRRASMLVHYFSLFGSFPEWDNSTLYLLRQCTSLELALVRSY